MFGGQDQEIYQAIGALLLPILPAGARAITTRAKVGDDWSEVAFAYDDAAGATRHFSFAQHPARTAGDIGELLIRLRKLMRQGGGDAWDECSLTLNREGRISTQFAYAPSPAA